MGEIIERQHPIQMPFGVKRQYHTLTKDCVSNEIFRRVHPQGLTMGEYMSQIVRPLFPEFDVHIVGNESSVLERIVPNSIVRPWTLMSDLLDQNLSLCHTFPNFNKQMIKVGLPFIKEMNKGAKSKQSRNLLFVCQESIDKVFRWFWRLQERGPVCNRAGKGPRRATEWDA